MRWLSRAGRLLLGLIALLLLWYATTPVYDFPAPTPFTGEGGTTPLLQSPSPGAEQISIFTAAHGAASLTATKTPRQLPGYTIA